jgi:hypothetical protein
MDLALIIDKLVPGADYRRADDIAALTETWVDARPIPSEEAINAAWAEIEAAQAAALNPVPVPVSVLSHQLFTALSRHSISEATIAAIINGMPEGQAKVEADLAFRRAPQIRRDHPIAIGIATALSLSVETVDQIFREAAEI